MLEKLSRDELTIDQSNNSCEGCVADENGREQLKPSATGFCKQCSDWLCDSCIAVSMKPEHVLSLYWSKCHLVIKYAVGSLSFPCTFFTIAISKGVATGY